MMQSSTVEPPLPHRFPLLFNRRWPTSQLAADLAKISAQELALEYFALRAAAPRRSTTGKRYFVDHDGRPGSGEATSRREEHCAIALVSLRERWPLMDGGWVELLDYQVPLKARLADQGVGKIDILGLTDAGRLVVIELKISSAGSGSRGEPPPCALMEAIRYAALVEADIEAIAREIRVRYGKEVLLQTPIVMILGPQSWWRDWSGPEVNADHWLPNFIELTRSIEALTGVSTIFHSWDDIPFELGLNGSAPRFLGVPNLAGHQS